MAHTFEVVLDQIGPSTSRATARSHSVVVDRPIAKGGADQGPVGGEYMLVALGGCFTSHLLAAIRARDAHVASVRTVVRGTLGGTPERFTDFTISVSAECEDTDLFRKLVTIAERGCQVVNTLTQAAPVTVTVESPVRAG